MSSKKVFEVAMILSATDKASRVITDAFAKSEARMKSFSKLGDKAFAFGAGAGVAGAGIIGGLGLTVKAAEESEIANRRLELTFKTMGETTNKAAKDSENYANKLQMQIGVEDEEIQMVQSKLATFKRVSDEGARASGVFNRATAAAYDLQAAGFGEASQNAVLLGKALQDPARGATALARTGALNKSDVPLIKQIQATKGLAAAQEYVLNRVEKQVKGQAANTATSGAKMKVTFAEVAETLGKGLLPQVQKTIKSIGDAANRFNKWAQDNPKLIGTITSLIGKVGLFSLAVSATSFILGGVFKAISAVIWIGNAYRTLMLTMKAAQVAYTFTLLSTGSGFAAVSAGLQAMNLGFLTSPIFWGIAILVGIVVLIVKYWTPIKKFFSGLWDGIKTIFTAGWEFFKKWGLLLLGPIGLIIKYWDKIKTFFANLWPAVKAIFWKALEFYLWLPKKFFSIGSDIVLGIWNGIKAKATALFNFVKEIGSKIASVFKSVLGINSPSKVFMQFGTNITEGVHEGVKKGAPSAISATGRMGEGMKPNSKQGGGGSGGFSFHFSPSISGGGNAQDILAELKKYTPQLIREIESVLERKRRLSF